MKIVEGFWIGNGRRRKMKVRERLFWWLFLWQRTVMRD